MNLFEIKSIVEALLFSSKEEIPFEKLRQIIASTHDVSNQDLKAVLIELKREYELQGKAFRLEESPLGYILKTLNQYHPYILQLHGHTRQERLSQASLETLAIIAYKQPITRLEIEQIRGVDCSGVLISLQEKELIDVHGVRETLGRPKTFVTTKEFLRQFGLNSIQDLPHWNTAK